jgi:hypothetical protein
LESGRVRRRGCATSTGVAAGIDTVDQDLDIVVEPDLTWRWKDEEEFADHLAHPEAYWVDDPEAVWAEGRRVVQLIEAGAHPYDGARASFRPDPEWAVPSVLPTGWDRPRHASPQGADSDKYLNTSDA